MACEVDHQKVLVCSELDGVDRIDVTEFMFFKADLVLLFISQVTHVVVEHFLQEITIKEQDSDVVAVNGKRALNDFAELILALFDVDQQTV